MDRLAYLLIGNRTVSDDLVSDAFSILFERYDQVDNPGGYLRVVLVRLCSVSRKRRATESARLGLLANMPAVGLGTSELDETWGALDRLAPERRAVVVLRFYEDLSHAQIAELLGCPVATVRTRLHRALADLRTEVGR